MHTVLSIAGSDSSGGAGLQADLKTVTCLGEYGMTVITALTAQNTMGVTGIENVSVPMVQKQIDAVCQDIYPDAVKIGMISSPEIMEAVCGKLIEYHLRNVVVDPVMVATAGSSLMEEDAVAVLKEKLLPLADIITPNLSEAQVLSRLPIHNREDMIEAAKVIGAYYKGAILIKGGHLTEEAADLLFEDGQIHWFTGRRYNNPNTHGTGCTLSSAIATYLAKGYDKNTSVEYAKKYVADVIAADLNLGKGRGPLWHNFRID